MCWNFEIDSGGAVRRVIVNSGIGCHKPCFSLDSAFQIIMMDLNNDRGTEVYTYVLILFVLYLVTCIENGDRVNG